MTNLEEAAADVGAILDDVVTRSVSVFRRLDGVDEVEARYLTLDALNLLTSELILLQRAAGEEDAAIYERARRGLIQSRSASGPTNTS